MYSHIFSPHPYNTKTHTIQGQPSPSLQPPPSFWKKNPTFSISIVHPTFLTTTSPFPKQNKVINLSFTRNPQNLKPFAPFIFSSTSLLSPFQTKQAIVFTSTIKHDLHHRWLPFHDSPFPIANFSLSTIVEQPPQTEKDKLGLLTNTTTTITSPPNHQRHNPKSTAFLVFFGWKQTDQSQDSWTAILPMVFLFSTNLLLALTDK